MEIVPLSPALGVEVRGIDVRDRLDDDQVARLRAAFDAHHLLLVRGQDVDEATQERFVSTFGPLIDGLGDGRTSRLLSNVLENAAGDGELPFHSDMAFGSSPVQAIALYALEIPAGGTETRFANAVAAWADLPDDLRERATGRRAWHADGYPETGIEGARTRDRVLSATAPRAAHELPLVHPRTGVPILFLNELHVERLEGLDGADDDGLVDGPDEGLVDALLSHLYAPAHVHELRWELHDLAVWDNLALQHARRDVSTVGARTFRRNTVNTTTT